MTSSISTTPTTEAPCPWWCDLPAGHGWDSRPIGMDCLERPHQHVVGEVASDRGPITVDVSVWERIVEYPNGVLGDVVGFVEPPKIDITADATDGLTAVQARALAAQLLEAADLFDRVVAGR